MIERNSVDTRGTYDVLERLGNLLRAGERSAGSEFGLQPVHLHALSYLSRCNRYSDNLMAITDYLAITKGTASQTLRLLQDKGLIVGSPDTKDGRKVHLRLTSKGEHVVGQIVPPMSLQRGLAELGGAAPAIAAQFAELLGAMQRGNELRGFGVCRTCHFRRPGEESGVQCGLTGETLTPLDSGQICREHQPA